MKPFLSITFAAVLLLLSGCGKEPISQPMVSEVPGPEAATAAVSEDTAPTGAVVDLTKLSSTMVYSEVYNMLASPDSYVGKTVKMAGTSACLSNPETNKLYYACIIADAAACCAEGMEFVLKDDLAYPDDYPEPGAEITVVGEFQAYEENGMTGYHLINARLESSEMRYT